ncbi:MAG: hypothetical protein DRO12_03515 [Thermoprotei archaeon]|nr:MAG: hypothetical protein DRO12_03515 [Thermoprotei archaeon]
MMILQVNYAEEWDWLVILDACRYDFFERYAFPEIRKMYPNAKLEKRISLASETTGVLEKFPRLPNSVVLTGHPFVLLRKDKFDLLLDAGFNYRLSTCPPWYMTTAFTIYYRRMIGYKRRILWFLQPHHPFIGKVKLNIRIYEGGKGSPLHTTDKIIKEYEEYKKRGILVEAYKENLILVVDYLKKILPKMNGKIIITSDHGEGLGIPLRKEDKPILSHPGKRNEWELRLIPWCVIHNPHRSLQIPSLLFP